mmetsp:Transcript_20002/g.49915  ORF Transcript_20002/g.49915 Transcript_20002/m.49915 type:complete len:100 (+) Transcript_20002:160-459(+)
MWSALKPGRRPPDDEIFSMIANSTAIPNGWLGLDIGPTTAQDFQAALEHCRAMYWRGPMGVDEYPQFAKGTHELLHFLIRLRRKRSDLLVVCDGHVMPA